MRVLSSAFYRLKTIIPWVPHDTKLSKLDTLRLARNYIAYLSATLDGQPANEITNKMPHPQKMVSFIVSGKFSVNKSERNLFLKIESRCDLSVILTTFHFFFLSVSLFGEVDGVEDIIGTFHLTNQHFFEKRRKSPSRFLKRLED